MSPPGLFGIGIGRGVHRVVVILGVHRIDGDERKLAPILTAGKAGGLCGLGFGERVAAEEVRNAMGVDGDEADRAFALQRAEFFLDARRRQTVVALPYDVDRDEVAVLGVLGGARRDGKLLAELLLVDRNEPAAAAGHSAEDAEHALRRAVDDFYDAPGEANGIAFVAGFLDAQQRAIADAGGFGGPVAARRVNADFRRRPVRFLVPFGRDRDQFAVAVARGDVG